MGTYLALFWSFFQIGALSFGGGYAAMPLIQNQVVELHHWLTMSQFADVVTISGMTPGPIAINAATFVGTQLAGLVGAVVATLGCVTPSCIIVLGLAYLYSRYQQLPAIQGILSGLRPAVVAMIGSAGLDLLVLAIFPGGQLALSPAAVDWLCVVIFLVCLWALRRFHLDQLVILLISGAAGFVLFYLLGL